MLKKLHPHQSQSNGFAVFKESVSRMLEVVTTSERRTKRSLTPTAAGRNFVYVFLVLSNFVFTSRAVEIQFCDFFFLLEEKKRSLTPTAAGPRHDRHNHAFGTDGR